MLVTKPDNPGVSQKINTQNERTDSYKLSTDLYTHLHVQAHIHTYIQINKLKCYFLRLKRRVINSTDKFLNLRTP